jgi:hypothetical protein
VQSGLVFSNRRIRRTWEFVSLGSSTSACVAKSVWLPGLTRTSSTWVIRKRPQNLWTVQYLSWFLQYLAYPLFSGAQTEESCNDSLKLLLRYGNSRAESLRIAFNRRSKVDAMRRLVDSSSRLCYSLHLPWWGTFDHSKQKMFSLLLIFFRHKGRVWCAQNNSRVQIAKFSKENFILSKEII